MNQLDIAVLAVASTPGRPEGIGAYTAALATHLASLGLSVEVWVQRRAQDGSAPVLDSRTIGVWRRGLFLGLDLLAWLRRRRPQILHVQFEFRAYGGATGVFSLLMGLMVARLVFRQRVMVTVHQVLSARDLTRETLGRLGVRLHSRIARAFAGWVMAGLGRWSDALIVHADIFRERLIADWKARADRIHVIPHGVPVLRGSDVKARGPRLLVFGYIKRYKGIEMAIEAFARIATEFPQWTLTIAGPMATPASPSERYLDELKALASPLGARVEFVGPVEDPAAEDLFAHASIVLFPYRVLFAASGPMAQAIGAHTPFIISEELRPICPEWPLWCAADVEEWARMLRGLMGDARRWAEAQRMAASRAASSDWGLVAAQTAGLYRVVCALAGRRQPGPKTQLVPQSVEAAPPTVTP